jgi:hypothetical protein
MAASLKAISDNSFQHSSSLIGIIATRFDSRWRYKNSYPISIFHATLSNEVSPEHPSLSLGTGVALMSVVGDASFRSLGLDRGSRGKE